MNWLNTTALLLVALIAVFLEAAISVPRVWLGAQIDALPALMVYAGLSTGWTPLALLAAVGGLGFDALSANPLGVSVLPLFGTGCLVRSNRDLILRSQPYAQFVLGSMASVAVPASSLLILVTMGEQPLLGWGTVWQLLVMGLGGGALTPLLFYLLDHLQRAFSHPAAAETSFRPDREIKRGRFV